MFNLRGWRDSLFNLREKIYTRIQQGHNRKEEIQLTYQPTAGNEWMTKLSKPPSWWSGKHTKEADWQRPIEHISSNNDKPSFNDSRASNNIKGREKEKQTKEKTSVPYGNDVTKCKHVSQENREGEQLVVWEREPRKGLKYLRLREKERQETECKWLTFSSEYPGMRTFRVVKREVGRIQMAGKICGTYPPFPHKQRHMHKGITTRQID